jgi:hypothetical protein
MGKTWENYQSEPWTDPVRHAFGDLGTTQRFGRNGIVSLGFLMIFGKSGQGHNREIVKTKD